MSQQLFPLITTEIAARCVRIGRTTPNKVRERIRAVLAEKKILIDSSCLTKTPSATLRPQP